MGKSGIIYIMTTSVNGLIKIGKTDNFKNRMNFLEQNGYWNVSGLKRFFAVRVDNYDKKEKLIHTMFSKSQVANSELFALDKHVAQELLESFGGIQIYPEVVAKPTKSANKKPAKVEPEPIIVELKFFPPCHMGRKIKAWGNKIPNARMKIQGGKYVVLEGSELCPIESSTASSGAKKRREKATIKNNILMSDEEFESPSAASDFVCFCSDNGWTSWKLDTDDKPLQSIRSEIEDYYKEVRTDKKDDVFRLFNQ